MVLDPSVLFGGLEVRYLKESLVRYEYQRKLLKANWHKFTLFKVSVVNLCSKITYFMPSCAI